VVSRGKTAKVGLGNATDIKLSHAGGAKLDRKAAADDNPVVIGLAKSQANSCETLFLTKTMDNR
jgi:hypothetical protein